ncbi:MAG: class II D-tagatose-bisphosphate aldolase, non-catalytic subunit, partial [Firmicutes bacterium]|nr:class II D-tagatose-bisphosphate aldolase, non-catalytic subunit [Bacillota bacterium]
MGNYMKDIIERRKAGELIGIPSYCTSNELVIDAVLRRAAETGLPVLIEATANQVNQFGGYTGMKPQDYYEWVSEKAKRLGVEEDKLILAGDHLGPLTWQNLPEEEAMANAEELVYLFAKAGFTKIHLDTSMKVADDPEGLLETETIARRGARLYKMCMKGYAELLEENPDAIRPVFIIGSEVPIPGGAEESEDSLAVTKPEALEDTIETYKRVFAEEGVPEGMEDVIAVVVQPGVEFGDDQIFLYDREAASELTAKAKDYPDFVLEGHSTDYQSKECLRGMVLDGIAILKVGPALTYALREALFALSLIEKELLPAEEQAGFIETLEQVMIEEPSNWKKHYHGDEHQQKLARRYSFSDRARYYIGDSRVTDTIDRLFKNLSRLEIPMNMLHQYMPVQFGKVRKGALKAEPEALVRDAVTEVLREYE